VVETMTKYQVSERRIRDVYYLHQPRHIFRAIIRANGASHAWNNCPSFNTL